MKKVFIVIVIVGIIVIGVVAVKYNLNRPRIMGTVTNLLDKSALIGATVTATGVDFSVMDITATAITDHEGKYTIKRLKQGEYEIRASMDGFVTSQAVRVVLTSGEPVEAGVLPIFPRPRGEGLFYPDNESGDFVYLKENRSLKSRQIKKYIVLNKFSGNVIEDDSPVFIAHLQPGDGKFHFVSLEYQYPVNILEYDPTWKFDRPMKFQQATLDSTLSLIKIDFLPKGYYALYTISENLLDIEQVWDFKIAP